MSHIEQDKKKAGETHTWHGCIHGYDTRIKMPCPSCGSHSLFIGSGGHITCGYLPCKSPLLSDNIKALTEARQESVGDFIKHHHNPIVKQKNEEIASLESTNSALENKVKELEEELEQCLEEMRGDKLYNNWKNAEAEITIVTQERDIEIKRARAAEAKLARALEALKNIKAHMETVAGNAYTMSSTWILADKAIAEIEGT